MEPFNYEEELKKLNERSAKDSELIMRLNAMRVFLLETKWYRLLLLRFIDKGISEVKKNQQWNRHMLELTRAQTELKKRIDESGHAATHIQEYKRLTDQLLQSLKEAPNLKWVGLAHGAVLGFELGRKDKAKSA